MTNSEAAKIVRTILCRGLTNQQTEQIVNAMVPTTVPAGNAVFREGRARPGACSCCWRARSKWSRRAGRAASS